MKKVLIIIVAVLALAGFGIYKLFNSVGKAGEAGDAAVAVFHDHYNAKRVNDIHSAAAPGFRTAVPAGDFSALVEMLHDKLGERKSGERSGINLNTNNGDTTLTLSYDSKFAKASGTEEFVFDYNGDVPLLLGYNVKSPALIELPETKEADKAAEKPAEPANQ